MRLSQKSRFALAMTYKNPFETASSKDYLFNQEKEQKERKKIGFKWYN
jgi:hypothetical protein